MKLTDEQIIKALGICGSPSSVDCSDCPLSNQTPMECMGFAGESGLVLNALDLINRQKAEIERLQIRNKTLSAITRNYDWKFARAKSEAIKEFAERLK